MATFAIEDIPLEVRAGVGLGDDVGARQAAGVAEVLDNNTIVDADWAALNRKPSEGCILICCLAPSGHCPADALCLGSDDGLHVQRD